MEITADLRRTIVNTIRMLAVDAVEQAKSGHPGAPMGQAELAHVLFHEFLRFDPTDPEWPARDRFVLSCGHGSMLQYALLHLWGYPLELDDLKQFRQWGSLTPGHPEAGHTAGVEVTTGPLGQGVAQSVGMALAARMMQARLAAEGEDFDPMPQRVFTICSDGDLMEGISSEAASLAGHWRLSNLIWLYDDNGITIDGDTDIAFSEDVGQRFEAFGWRVLRADGHNADEVRAALARATDAGAPDQPVLIICKTHIGYGSPNKVDSSKAHGSPLGADEIKATKEVLGWPTEPTFLVPDEVKAFFTEAQQAKTADRKAYEAEYTAWRSRQPEAAARFDDLWAAKTPEDFAERLLASVAGKEDATRKLSAAVIDAALEAMPAFVGGSADLTGSNGINMKSEVMVGYPGSSRRNEMSFAGRKMHFGIREHAMGAITNGMLLHGGLRPFNATFLVFSDYLRPSIRLAALSRLPNVFVLSHDSVFLGEDGPTHQPVEHHWALRTIPDFHYFRPADAVEVAMTWSWALGEAELPIGVSLTRQKLPAIERRADFDAKEVWRGGYVVTAAENPEVVLVGTGSELQLCCEAAKALTADGHRVQVVSMPSFDLFREQDEAWQRSVIPAGAKVCTIEAGITDPWAVLTGLSGLRIGIDRFGASAPMAVIAEEFGLTTEKVLGRIREWLG
ncbi:MAG: transketolase [Bradymonadia bacterium]